MEGSSIIEFRRPLRPHGRRDRIPGSIEAYYQEIGRAGRDGRPATATLLWMYADVCTREFLIDHGREDDVRRGSRGHRSGGA